MGLGLTDDELDEGTSSTGKSAVSGSSSAGTAAASADSGGAKSSSSMKGAVAGAVNKMNAQNEANAQAAVNRIGKNNQDIPPKYVNVGSYRKGGKIPRTGRALLHRGERAVSGKRFKSGRKGGR